MSALLEAVRAERQAEIERHEHRLGRLDEAESIALELAGVDEADLAPGPRRVRVDEFADALPDARCEPSHSEEPEQLEDAGDALRDQEPEPQPEEPKVGPDRDGPELNISADQVLAVLRDGPLTMTAVADRLGYPRLASGMPPAPAKRAVAMAIAELEGEGKVKAAGKQGRGVLWAVVEEASRPKSAPASTKHDAGATDQSNDDVEDLVDEDGQVDDELPEIDLPAGELLTESLPRPKPGDSRARSTALGIVAANAELANQIEEACDGERLSIIQLAQLHAVTKARVRALVTAMVRIGRLESRGSAKVGSGLVALYTRRLRPEEDPSITIRQAEPHDGLVGRALALLERDALTITQLAQALNVRPSEASMAIHQAGDLVVKEYGNYRLAKPPEGLRAAA